VLAVKLSAADLATGEKAARAGDFDTALRELVPLANDGVHEAHVWAGPIYFARGDYPKALPWLRMTANEGHAVSQIFFAQMYRDGKGIPKSYVEAYKWLFLAASKDDRAEQLRVSLAARMTPSEISEAERRAQQWTPRVHLFVPKPKVSPPTYPTPRGGA